MRKKLVVALFCHAIYPRSPRGRKLRYNALLLRLPERVDMHVYTMHWRVDPKVYTDGEITYHATSTLLPMRTKGREALRWGLMGRIHATSALIPVLDW